MAGNPSKMLAILMGCIFLRMSACWAAKETNLVFYLHDTETGKNITAIAVAGTNGSYSDALKFGTVLVADDPVTEGPDPFSPVVGRAQGIFPNVDVGGRDVHVVFSLVFQNKQYNGSTLEFQGANRFYLPHREVSVVGGTGQFRFARGFAIIQTYSFSGLNAIAKFDVTVRTD